MAKQDQVIRLLYIALATPKRCSFFSKTNIIPTRRYQIRDALHSVCSLNLRHCFAVQWLNGQGQRGSMTNWLVISGLNLITPSRRLCTCQVYIKYLSYGIRRLGQRSEFHQVQICTLNKAENGSHEENRCNMRWRHRGTMTQQPARQGR